MIRCRWWLRSCGLGLVLIPMLALAAGPAPELASQAGHSKGVYRIAFSRDGRRLVTASADGTARLWDLETALEVRAFVGHTKYVKTVAFSPDGALVLTGSEDRTVRGWDTATGQPRFTLEGLEREVEAVAVAPDGQSFACGDGPAVALYRVDASPTKIETLAGHGDRIRFLQFLPDGRLVSGSADGTVRIWDVASGKEQHKLAQGATPLALSVTADGSVLAVGDTDESVRLWNTRDGKELATFKGSLYGSAISPDGSRLAISGFADTVIWDVRTKTEVGRIPQDRVQHPVFTPDGQRLAVTAGNGVRFFEVATRRELRGLVGRTAGLLTVAAAPRGPKVMATGGVDKLVRLWDLETGRLLRTLAGHKDWIFQVAFSPDGSLLASAGSYDHLVKVWNVATGREVATLTRPERLVNGAFESLCVTGVAFLPDGKHLVSVDADKTVTMWRLEGASQLWTARGHARDIMALAVSPDGRTVATGDNDGQIRFWSVSSGNALGSARPGSPVRRSLAFSPDGRRLAAGTEDGRVLLYDVASAREVAVGKGHTRDIQGVAFSPDGRWLLSGSDDGTARRWDAATLTLEATWQHGGEVDAVAFLPDGRALAGGLGGTTLWDVATGNLIVRLLGIDREDFLAVTPDNYYAGSPAGAQGLAFRVGSQVFPFEQFDLKYNRPDLVLARLGAGKDLVASYRQAYLKRLKKMRLTEEQLGTEVHVPTVTVTSPPPPLSTTERTFTFKVRAKDDQHPLDRLNVYQNDVPIHGVGGIDLRTPKTSDLERELALQLAAGSNKIQVSVLNSRGVESLRQTFRIDYTGPTTEPDLYVVAIGVSRYRSSEYDLGFAAKDAGDLAAFFASQTDRFGQVHVTKILDQDATRARILAVRATLEKSRVDDEVVLFVAGHGLLDRQLDYYLATTDIDFRNPAPKGLAYQDLEGLVDGIPALRKLILIDTCHSGEVDPDDPALLAESTTSEGTVKPRAVRGFLLGGKPAPSAKKAVPPPVAPALGLAGSIDLQRALFADLRRGSGAMVISSAGGAEFALESATWNNGVFTYAVLEGLKSGRADQNEDGTLRVSELRDHVIEKVRSLTQGRQTPTARQENLEVDFPVF
ncbi:MAG: caspase family protein [Myxococcota bacterium]|jgi:WD40 repeat protein|nr:caspase family protein [Myxococcota bacterium]